MEIIKDKGRHEKRRKFATEDMVWHCIKPTQLYKVVV